MHESVIEKSYRKEAKDTGSRLYKWTSPGEKGVPDDIALRSIPEEHREIVARYVRFVEFKAPGKKPDPWQVRQHEILRGLGFTVLIVDSIEKGLIWKQNS